MESLLGQVSGDGGDSSQGSVPTPDQAHSQLTQAVNSLTPDQFHAAAVPALGNLSNDQRAAVANALSQAGAAQGAGVQAGSTDANSISKMMHWVQTNVPGGIPAVLAAVGVAGGAAAVAGSGEGGNLAAAGSNAAQSAQSSGGGLLHSVLGSVMPALNDAISKVGK